MTELLPAKRPSRWRVGIALAGLVLAAVALPVPPQHVERFYSGGFYRVLQPRLTSLSNLVAFPLFDAALVVVIALWVGLAAHDFIRVPPVWRAGWQILARTATWAAVGYLCFLATWGFNYRRVRLVDALPFDANRVTRDGVIGAATVAAERLNALYESGRDGVPPPDPATPDPALAGSLQRALGDIGHRHRLVAGRPKRTILDLYFRRAGVDGMTDPFFLETLIASDMLPVERPFVLAHEWAHLAGIADEGEANFLGWLACLRASPAAQYSGWLFLYRELAQSVPPPARTSIAATLGPGPRADLRAINERVRRNLDPRLSAVGWSVYDSYLKANRVEAGAASYGEVVRLVLGSRLPSGWEPLAP
jgi:hypothetical protein